MKKYICEPCGYEYDPEIGDPDKEGCRDIFRRSSRRLVCPICGLGKRSICRNLMLVNGIVHFIYKNPDGTYLLHRIILPGFLLFSKISSINARAL